jgi:DnaD/phage-associated family protein
MVLQWQEGDGPEWLLPGNPEGRSLLEKLASSSVKPSTLRQASPIPLEAPQNIFALYEANIGVLTPLIAEQLKEDQNEYPLNWIQDAVAEALLQNVRNWKYVRAILKRWKTEGRSGKYEEDRDNRDKFRELYRGEQPDRP